MRSIVDRNVVMRRMTVFLISALNDSGHCALLHYTISCATVLYCTTQSPVPLCCTVLHNLLCHYSTVHNLLCHCVLLYYTISCATTLLCTISCATVLYCTTQSPVPLCSTVLHNLLCHCAVLCTISCQPLSSPSHYLHPHSPPSPHCALLQLSSSSSSHKTSHPELRKILFKPSALQYGTERGLGGAETGDVEKWRRLQLHHWVDRHREGKVRACRDTGES